MTRVRNNQHIEDYMLDGGNTNTGAIVSSPLILQTNKSQMDNIRAFRHRTYKRLYPSINNLYIDPFDVMSYVLFSYNMMNHITSTGRLVIDGDIGLPDEDCLSAYIANDRKCGIKLAEFGRFCIENSSPNLLKSYYSSIYKIAIFENVSKILMVMRVKNYLFHRRMIRGEIIPGTKFKYGFGSKFEFIGVAWTIKNTPQCFFRWCNTLDQLHIQENKQ